jgi:N-acetylglucosamine transport system substrate-binding protein
MSATPENPTNLTRRAVFGKAATVALLATPAAGLLSGCMGGGDDPQDQAEGTKSTENPLGVKEDAALEVVIFNGGLGTKYATEVHIPSYKKKFPKAEVKFSQSEEIATVLQPRFTSNTPPDMVNNAGSKLMDMGALVQAGQVSDLTELFEAPALDVPGKKVKETLVPGAIDQGSFNGKPHVLNYAFTVYGLWYDSALFAKNSWTAPATWADFTALCDKMKAVGVTPFGYAGANAAYYMYLVLLTSAAKIGGPDVLKHIDNLEEGAWQADAVKQAAAAWAGIGAKFTDKAFGGLKHTEVQLKQNQGRIGFYPSGSWLENEQAKDTPATFKYAVTPIPSVTTSDKMPATAIFAAAGEMYFASAKGKNPRGAMEYLRHMLSMEGAKGFTERTKVLTIVQGAVDGLEISPGLTSGNTMLKAAGSDYFSYRWADWYKKLDDECRSATNELMFNGGSAKQFCDRMQKAADSVKSDSSIQKFTR